MDDKLCDNSNVEYKTNYRVGLALWLACPVGRGFAPRPGHNIDHQIGINYLPA